MHAGLGYDIWEVTAEDYMSPFQKACTFAGCSTGFTNELVVDTFSHHHVRLKPCLHEALYPPIIPTYVVPHIGVDPCSHCHYLCCSL